MAATETFSAFDKPVLMVYAVLPKIQASKKKLFEASLGYKGLQLFKDLHAHTREVAEASGLEVFWFFDHELAGENFGERYSSAFATLFDKGYQKIISIGNDIPQLQASHIQEAVELLEKQSAVLGPTADGGDYLIGFSADSFHSDNFQKLPWNTGHLHQKLCQLLEKNDLPVFILEKLIDIDDLEALHSIRRSFNFNWIKILFQSLKQNSPFTPFLKRDFLIQRDNPLRAPPEYQG